MTRTFERFLRSFDDEDLVTFARDRASVRPPYWRALAVALRIELDRRGLEQVGEDAASSGRRERDTRAVTG